MPLVPSWPEGKPGRLTYPDNRTASGSEALRKPTVSPTTGTEPGNFVVVPPGWRPELRDGLIEEFKLPKDTQRIDAPTRYVWIVGRANRL
jgi:hypothetical protein